MKTLENGPMGVECVDLFKARSVCLHHMTCLSTNDVPCRCFTKKFTKMFSKQFTVNFIKKFTVK